MTEHFPDGDDLSYPGALPLDVEKYRPYVDHFDITDEQKIKLLETLWSIMTAFVRHGFGVDSVQRCIPELAEFSSQAESGDDNDSDTASPFNSAASKQADDEEP